MAKIAQDAFRASQKFCHEPEPGAARASAIVALPISEPHPPHPSKEIDTPEIIGIGSYGAKKEYWLSLALRNL